MKRRNLDVYHAWYTAEDYDWLIGSYESPEEAESALRALEQFKNVSPGPTVAGRVWTWTTPKGEEFVIQIENNNAN